MKRRLCGAGSLALRLLLSVVLFSSWQLLAGPVAAEPSPRMAQMVDLVNRLRAESGLALLVEDATLDDLAGLRSSDMASRGYFSHTNPDGQTVFSLMEQRRISFRVAGENIAYNWLAWETDPVDAAYQLFQSSPPHRATLLDPDFAELGVGIASDGSKTFFTLVFRG